MGRSKREPVLKLGVLAKSGAEHLISLQLIGFSVPVEQRIKKSGEKSQCGQRVAVEEPVFVANFCLSG